MIKLIDHTRDDQPFGNKEGRKVYQELLKIVDDNPGQNVFEISLKGIKATDASFPRESIVSLAKQFRGEKGFYLTDFVSNDLIDNWNYAAVAKEQPLVIWDNDDYQVIGPNVTSSTNLLLDFILSEESVTTAKVSEKLNISVQNASTKLKKLKNQGYILRSEDAAESGGVEFLYHRIK